MKQTALALLIAFISAAQSFAGGIIFYTSGGSPYINVVQYETYTAPSAHLSYITVKGGQRTQIQSAGIIANIPLPTTGTEYSLEDIRTNIAQADAMASRQPKYAQAMQKVSQLWNDQIPVVEAREKQRQIAEAAARKKTEETNKRLAEEAKRLPQKQSNENPQRESVASTNTNTPDQTAAASASAPNGSKNVVATGVGKNNGESLTNAFLQAVQNVVGTIVEGSTLIENEKIISDKVLTLSNGYIETYQALETREQDGLIYTKISAVVKKDKLEIRLQELGVIKVDGRVMFGEALTRARTTEDATAMLDQLFSDFPANCIKVTPQTPLIGELKNNAVEVGLPLFVTVDAASYNVFIDKLARVLGSLAIKTSTLTVSPQNLKSAPIGSIMLPTGTDYYLRHYYGYALQNGIGLWTFNLSINRKVHNIKDLYGEEIDNLKTFTVLLSKSSGPNVQQVALTRYDLNLKYLPLFKKYSELSSNILVTIRDNANDKLFEVEARGLFPRSEKSSLLGIGKKYSYPESSLSLSDPALLESDVRIENTRVFTIAPFFVYHFNPTNVGFNAVAFSTELRFLKILHLTDQQVKNVGAIDCRAIMADSSSKGNEESATEESQSEILKEIQRQAVYINIKID